MPRKRPTNSANGSSAVAARSASLEDRVWKILSKVPEIEAVFLLADSANVVHIFSVVREFQSKIYDKLLKKEKLIERDAPEIAFEFHVRAHQGRKPAAAVPFEATLVHAR